MRDQIAQAEATLAATEAQRAAVKPSSRTRAQPRRARAAHDEGRHRHRASSSIRRRTAYDVAKSQLAALAKQIDAQRAAVALARANAEQVAIRRSQLQANQQQQAAATAQRAKADVRLAYTEMHAPIAGIVDVRAARVGRGGHARAAGRHADQPRRPVGAGRRRGDLHRPRPDRRHADGPPAVGRRASRARCSIAASTPASPPSATSAGPSATSRRSRSGCACDNTDRRLAVGMTAYVPAAAACRSVHDDVAIDVRQHRQEVRRLHRRRTASPSRWRRARSSACSARTAPASRR